MDIRHFIDLWPIERSELRAILDEAHRMKRARAGWPKGRVDAGAPLDGHTLAMIFEKASTRTRFSFDMAMRQLGGSSITTVASDMQLGRGETIEDTARVLSRYVDAVMIRANDHTDIEVFSEASGVPVINGLSDRSHPCQIMADLMTLEEHGLTLKGARLAWVGDGNNVCASFIHAAPKFGFSSPSARPSAMLRMRTIWKSPPNCRAGSISSTPPRKPSPALMSSSPTPSSQWATWTPNAASKSSSRSR